MMCCVNASGTWLSQGYWTPSIAPLFLPTLIFQIERGAPSGLSWVRFDILPSASRGIPNLAVFGSFCFLSSYLAHFGTNDMLSPTGTDPDRPNPQTFCFTSTLCPNAEGFKDLFSFDFLFLKLCRPCYSGISSWSSILIGELPICLSWNTWVRWLFYCTTLEPIAIWSFHVENVNLWPINPALALIPQ